MASHVHVYLGPYLRVTKQYADGNVTERSCVKVDCKNHKTEFHDSAKKFCEKCGSAIDNVTKVKRVEVPEHFYQLADQIDEAFCEMTPENLQDVYRFMIPNISRGEKYRDMSLDVHWKKYCIDGKFIDREAELAWFTSNFAKEIEVYRNACGEKNVEITWGLFTYWN